MQGTIAMPSMNNARAIVEKKWVCMYSFLNEVSIKNQCVRMHFFVNKCTCILNDIANSEAMLSKSGKNHKMADMKNKNNEAKTSPSVYTFIPMYDLADLEDWM